VRKVRRSSVKLIGRPRRREIGRRARPSSVPSPKARPYPSNRRASAAIRAFEARVVPLFERSSLEPVIHGTFEPGDAPEAHRTMEENLNFGTLLLLWRE
jgi:NADPH:quinone reductase-like Zn-dependent oxidoreductase